MNPLIPAPWQRNLILASRSPRRRDILNGLAFDFEVVPAAEHVEDTVQTPDPYARPIERARSKAMDVARQRRTATVIGADTVVLVDGDVFEKPRDDDEARRFLSALSGREHVVVTGVVLCRNGREVAGSEITRVQFRKLEESEIDGYVASGEGRDKAGSYAVQGLGAALVRRIDGCFYNVVGLPVGLLFELLAKLGAPEKG